jgi:drug/metabolite transporter (DMT)-like permease
MKKAFWQLHGAVFLAGFTALFGKWIHLNEAVLVWHRMWISIVIMLLVYGFIKKRPKLSVRAFLKISAMGLVLSIHWVAFYGSVKYANVSVALVCLSATGFFSALLEPIWMKKRLKFIELGLGILAILGIGIIFDVHTQFQTGMLYGLLAALAGAIFPMGNRVLLKNHPPDELALVEFLGGWLGLSLLIPFYLRFMPELTWMPSGQEWIWLLLLAGICTVWAFDLQLKALEKLTAFTVNLTYNLEPLYGIVFAFFLFNEQKFLHIEFYWGMLLILASIGIQTYRVIRFRKQEE